METYINLFFLSVISVAFKLYDAFITLDENININVYLFIVYCANLVCILYLYFNILSKNDKLVLFSNKYLYIWIFCIISSLYGLFIHKIILNYQKELGVARYETISESLHIILTFLFSYYIFKTKININNIIGICMIILGICLINKL